MGGIGGGLSWGCGVGVFLFFFLFCFLFCFFFFLFFCGFIVGIFECLGIGKNNVWGLLWIMGRKGNRKGAHGGLKIAGFCALRKMKMIKMKREKLIPLILKTQQKLVPSAFSMIFGTTKIKNALFNI